MLLPATADQVLFGDHTVLFAAKQRAGYQADSRSVTGGLYRAMLFSAGGNDRALVESCQCIMPMTDPDTQAILDRLAAIERKQDDVLRLLAHLGDMDMTITDFAKRVGRSRTTIHAMVNRFEVVTRGGRIPVSELGKFVS